MTQLEKGAHSEAMEEEEEGEGGKEEEREEKAEYAGGRFAGVGEFAPALMKAAKKKVSLPLLTSKPEAVLRYTFSTSTVSKRMSYAVNFHFMLCYLYGYQHRQQQCISCHDLLCVTSLRFTEIPQQRHPEGASPSEISHHHMDLSYTLETMLEKSYTHCELTSLHKQFHRRSHYVLSCMCCTHLQIRNCWESYSFLSSVSSWLMVNQHLHN